MSSVFSAQAFLLIVRPRLRLSKEVESAKSALQIQATEKNHPLRAAFAPEIWEMPA
jgi:hypothetical protein